MPEYAIRRSDPMPYYAQLAQILREQIRDGVHEPGDLLPSEAELGETYGISRTAVRQALDELVDEGLVQKEKGRGTFVSRPKVAEFVVHELRGFFEEMTRRGAEVRTDVLVHEVTTAPPHVVPELQLSMGERTIRLDRLRRIGDEPIVLGRTFLPLPRFASLTDEDMSERSLYEILREEHGVHRGGGRRHFEAVAADDEMAEVLEVDRGAPLLKVTAVNFDQDDVPFEYFIAWYRGDRTAFDVLVEPAAGQPDAVLDVDADVEAAAQGESA
jgi:GntR family transcriptional regulator